LWKLEDRTLLLNGPHDNLATDRGGHTESPTAADDILNTLGCARRAVFAIVLAVTLTTNVAATQVLDADASLRSLREVAVAVILDSIAAANHVSKSALRTQVELEIRRLGVRVRTEADTSSWIPVIVGVVVNALRTGTGNIIGTAELQVMQDAMLLRPPYTRHLVISWEYSKHFISPPAELAEFVRTMIRDGMEDLANDYLRVNAP
jgi:hypothetical protein